MKAQHSYNKESVFNNNNTVNSTYKASCPGPMGWLMALYRKI